MILFGNDASANDLGEEYRWLRQEIIESQKTQADFFRWKLISIAFLFSISFAIPVLDGYAGAKLLICLVPLVSLYVDLISLPILIRMVAIGNYMKIHGSHYDKFIFTARKRSFERLASHGSTIIFDIIVMTLGVILPKGPDHWPPAYLNAYFSSGALGIAVTLLLWKIHGNREKEVIRLAEEMRRAE